MLMAQGGCPAPREEQGESRATISSLSPSWAGTGRE